MNLIIYVCKSSWSRKFQPENFNGTGRNIKLNLLIRETERRKGNFRIYYLFNTKQETIDYRGNSRKTVT